MGRHPAHYQDLGIPYIFKQLRQATAPVGELRGPLVEGTRILGGWPKRPGSVLTTCTSRHCEVRGVCGRVADSGLPVPADGPAVAGETGRASHQEGQFVAVDMTTRWKVRSTGNERVFLTARASFGYTRWWWTSAHCLVIAADAPVVLTAPTRCSSLRQLTA